MHISLTPELEKIVRSKVESGMYNNASEVIRESIRMMTLNENLVYDAKSALLKDAIRDGLQSKDAVGVSVFDVMNDVLTESKTTLV